ncbi:MAG TPA: hypothetical protein PKN56_08080 [Leptospiraceae bacterium]|nr:hypothetical protein [Leptospiraceae bacterium]HNN03503.1 hypothetical protein [Leptospiraceae bacterium]
MKNKLIKLSVYLGSGILSVLYGLSCQYAVRNGQSETASVLMVMSFGFIFLFPFSMGAVVVYFADTRFKKSFLFQAFAPWGVSAVSLFISMLVGWEGTICLIMALPVYLLMSSLGGLAMGAFLRMTSSKSLQMVSFAFLLITPFISGKIEQKFDLPQEIRTVDTEITVQAQPETLWSRITVIPKITEPQESFFYYMGFPKPVEATLSHEGVGGIREAVFERGLLFLERITVWEENRRLSFSILADPRSTPLTALDPHVTVGGYFFDTLLGEYEIEPKSEKETVLKLRSKFRVSTRFNFYSSLWADFLMADIQKNILRVIKSRAEKG